MKKIEGMIQRGPYIGQKYTMPVWGELKSWPRWVAVWLDDGKTYPVIREVREEILEDV